MTELQALMDDLPLLAGLLFGIQCFFGGLVQDFALDARRDSQSSVTFFTMSAFVAWLLGFAFFIYVGFTYNWPWAVGFAVWGLISSLPRAFLREPRSNKQLMLAMVGSALWPVFFVLAVLALRAYSAA